MTYETEYEIAIAAVREAARLCEAVQSNLVEDPLQKTDRSPVTVADFGSQAVICRMLGDAFPDDPVIAEEDSSALRKAENRAVLERVIRSVSGVTSETSQQEICGWIDRGNASTYSDRFWTLDPIDGTLGFLRGDQYAVALALIVAGRPVVAAMACPKLDFGGEEKAPGGSVFTAVWGEGAWCYELNGTRRRPIRVSDEANPAEARFCESVESAHSSHSDAGALADVLGIVREPLRLDSQAKYAVVARGDAEIYLRLTKRSGYVERIWDHAAGALVVEVAGGRVTDLQGKPLEFSHGSRLSANVGIVATNGVLHDDVVSALEQVLVSD